jgi:DNA segregation ATPase FtsK/SpoIIIE, S-DNA-T family
MTMATAPKTRNASRPARRENARPPGQRRNAIIAILMIAASLLVFIALVTYDAADGAQASLGISDVFGVLRGDAAARARADVTHNGLGLVGAVISQFLIVSTFGYSVFVLPVLVAFWGWTILRKGDYRRSVGLTNHTLMWMLLISTTFGVIRRVFPETGPGIDWSGVVGDFFSTVMAQLLGKAGAAVLMGAALLVAGVVTADIDVHRMAELLRNGWLRLRDWGSVQWEQWQARREAAMEAREEAAEEEEPEPVAPPAREAKVKIERPPLEEFPLEESRRASTPMRVVNFGLKKDASGRPPDTGEADADGVILPTAAMPGGTESINYTFPTIELLTPPKPGKEDVDEAELQANAELLRETLLQFDVELESVSVTPGPVVTLYELVPASGVKISQIVSLENDIALKLAARGIRIMAPIPGKSAVGVEIPNSHRSLVTIRSVINSNAFRDIKAGLPIAMGKTISGEVFADDLTKMPHLLIAGSTGSGKSVGINTIIASLLFRMHPSDLKFVIVDPKKIELAQYARLKHHFLAVSPDVDEEIVTTPHNAVMALRGTELEMERRYNLLAAAGVRNIFDYNDKISTGKLKDHEGIHHEKMPYLVVVIDELADLMITAAREVEEPIARLTQLARAVGVHLIVATQRPSVDVITGVIKANFPARIAYQVASKTDSRTILDMNGAEQLLGNGDMLYLASGSPKPIRLQNAYISPDEVDAVVEHIGSQQGFERPFALPSMAERKRTAEAGGQGGRDELFEDAARLIVRHQQGSVSLLQRRLKVGYSRAARLVDELEAAGIVGHPDGSKAREVLIESEAELEAYL